MKKILILEPVWCNVHQEWGYHCIDECEYTARNHYYARQWVKRYNRWSGEDPLTVRVV